MDMTTWILSMIGLAEAKSY